MNCVLWYSSLRRYVGKNMSNLKFGNSDIYYNNFILSMKNKCRIIFIASLIAIVQEGSIQTQWGIYTSVSFWRCKLLNFFGHNPGSTVVKSARFLSVIIIWAWSPYTSSMYTHLLPTQNSSPLYDVTAYLPNHIYIYNIIVQL